MDVKMRMVGFLTVFLMLVATAPGVLAATDLGLSLFDQELQKVKYGVTDGASQGRYYASLGEDDVTLADLAQAEVSPPDYKSPGKAFLYSLAVPGLGQFYYGSRIKPAVFVAVEAAGWMYALKYHGEGDDKTDLFETFNRDHWSRLDYETYLTTVYVVADSTGALVGTTRPDTLPGNDYPEFTHVLPADKNQDYYEMTGKYNQFAWGWDDAEIGGLGMEEQPPPLLRITSDKSTIPISQNRETYQTMRGDANDKYDQAMQMVYVIMANHLISAFEAYFVTKSHNNRLRYEQEFARVKVKTGLRSYTSWKDTPYVTVTYAF